MSIRASSFVPSFVPSFVLSFFPLTTNSDRTDDETSSGENSDSEPNTGIYNPGTVDGGKGEPKC